MSEKQITPAELDIKRRDGDVITEDTIIELTNNKGEDDDEQ